MRGFKSLFSIILAVVFLSSVQSYADTFVVTNLNDSGEGSLRQAINTSNLVLGPDEIVFEEGLEGTIVLNLGQFDISDDLNINGPGADMLTIDADDSSRIFNISDGSTDTDILVSISGLMFINGLSGGGAILNFEDLSIDSCVFEGNSAIQAGGVIFNKEGSTIAEITNSTFSGNNAESGGVIFNEEGTIQNITNSTFNGNNSAGRGGGIDNEGTIENITNSTFSGNSAEDGGAIYNDGDINISFTTIANNEASAGGGIFEDRDSINIRNSIVAFNSPNNCVGPVNDLTGNWSNESSCGFLGDNSEIILGPLADNGGPTETMALLGGDPIDGATNNCDALNEMGNPSGIPIGIDQRYFPRPFGVRCDSGAFEEGEVPQPQPPMNKGGGSCGVDVLPEGGGLASIAPVRANNPIPLYFFIPVLILIRRIVKRCRS